MTHSLEELAYQEAIKHIKKNLEEESPALIFNNPNLTEIPEEITKFKTISSLKIESCKLSPGALDHTLSILPPVSKLYLNNLALKEIPNEIRALPCLMTLDLSNNLLHNTESLYGLIDLRTIDLSKNRFSEFPLALKENPQLSTILISDNCLRKLSENIIEFEYLDNLDLSKCLFSEFPESVTLLKRLHYLNLSYNQFKNVPFTIGRLKELRHLDLSNTLLEALPATVGWLRNLHSLNLSWTHLKDLPTSITDIPQLSSFTYPKHLLNPNSIYKNGLVDAYKNVLKKRRENIRTTVIQIAEGVKSIVQQYLVDFENFVMETERISISFSTKQTKNGLQLEVELPIPTDKNIEGKIHEAFTTYISLVRPQNQTVWKELLANSFPENTSKSIIEHYQNKVQYFYEGISVLQNIFDEQNVLLTSANKDIKSLMQTVDETLNRVVDTNKNVIKNRSSISEMSESLAEMQEIPSADYIFAVPYSLETNYVPYKNIVMFHIKKGDPTVRCYTENPAYFSKEKKGASDLIMPHVFLPTTLTLEGILEKWGEYFIWINKQTIINPMHVVKKWDVAHSRNGMIQISYQNMEFSISEDLKIKVWGRLNNSFIIKH